MELKINGTPAEVKEFLLGLYTSIENVSETVVAMPKQKKPSQDSFVSEDELVGTAQTIMRFLVQYGDMSYDDILSHTGITRPRLKKTISVMESRKWLTNADGKYSPAYINRDNQIKVSDMRSIIRNDLLDYPESTTKQIGQRNLIASSLVAARLIEMKEAVSVGEGGSKDPKKWKILQNV